MAMQWYNGRVQMYSIIDDYVTSKLRWKLYFTNYHILETENNYVNFKLI